MTVPKYVGLGATILLLIWLYGAWASGYFVFDRSQVVETDFSSSDVEAFSRQKQILDIGVRKVAVIDKGSGYPVILLHGCPFHSYEWRHIVPKLAKNYRVIAPDLLGLGDTPVRLDEDYRLPLDEEMVIALMDKLGLQDAYIVGHDHGGATLQLMMRDHPDRIRAAVLTNAEAYDQWPSKPEVPYLKLMVNRLTAPLFKLGVSFKPIQHEVFSIAHYNPEKTMSDADLSAYLRPSLSSPKRMVRFRRFFQWQLDPAHNQLTMDAAPALKAFDKPVLIAWGQHDTNFGPEIAKRLASDLPHARPIMWFENSAHMPMEEEPDLYAKALLNFFASVEHSEIPQSGTGLADAKNR